jgi:hypothetical protein
MTNNIDPVLTQKLKEWYKNGEVFYNPENENFIVDFGEGGNPVTVTTRAAAEAIATKPENPLDKA